MYKVVTGREIDAAFCFLHRSISFLLSCLSVAIPFSKLLIYTSKVYYNYILESKLQKYGISEVINLTSIRGVSFSKFLGKSHNIDVLSEISPCLRYFTCENNHGVFVRPRDVKKCEQDEEMEEI